MSHMTHDDLVAVILVHARRAGVLMHYCTNSRACTGKPGLPDVILAGPYGACFIEVKTPGDDLTPAQTTWNHMLQAGGEKVYVVREEHVGNGSLDTIISHLAGRAPAHSPPGQG